MRLKMFVEYFDISKESFELFVNTEKDISLENDEILTNEENELPNPDIIYTFDNEIIDAYYRRENPVEPDWSKTKTYESYEAYLKANGKTAE